MDKAVIDIKNEILTTAMATLEAEGDNVLRRNQLTLQGSKCGFFQLATCAGSLAATIASCIATGFTFGASLFGCITGVVTAGDSCYPCVCAVMHFIKRGSCNGLSANQETVTELESRIMRTALDKVNETSLALAQSPVLTSGGCSFWTKISCARSLSGTIAKCVKRGVRDIGRCIKDIIGVGDRCFPCVCDVLSFLHQFGFCSQLGTTVGISSEESVTELEHRILGTVMDKVHETSMAEWSAQPPVLTGGCGFFTVISCAKSLAGSIASCVVRGVKDIGGCVKDLIGAGDRCFPCVCSVLSFLKRFGLCSVSSELGNSSVVTGELSVTELENRVLRAVLVRVETRISETESSAQPTVLTSGSCSFFTVISCAKSLAGTIAKCVARNVRGIPSCIKDIIGTGNRCFPCVCSVLSLIDLDLCSSSDQLGSSNAAALEILSQGTATEIENRILSTALDKVGETSMEVWGAQPPVLASGSCGFMSLVSCAKSMAGTIAKCIKRGVRGLESCVKDFIGSGNRCYPCVCSVLSFIDNGYDCGVSSLTGQAVQGGGHLGWCLIFCRG